MTAQRHVAAVTALALTLASVTPLLAEEAATAAAPDPLVGSRVRIEQRVGLSGTSRTQGEFLGVDHNYLLLRREGASGERVRVPLADVDRIAVYRGERPATGRGRALGAVLGSVLGVGVGGYMSFTHCMDDGAISGECARPWLMGSAVGLGIAGGLAGSLVGSRRSNEEWETVPKPRVRPVVAIVPQKDGVRVALAFRF